MSFATVVTAEKINGLFRKHGGLFGGNGIYSSHLVKSYHLISTTGGSLLRPIALNLRIPG